MKIVEIRGYPLDAAMGSPIRNSVGVIERRSALIVELVTDTGVSGWGETQDEPAAAWQHIETALAPKLLGADADDERLGSLTLAPAGKVEALAASAIDIALWDVRARALGVPIAELAGGALRDHLPAYASGPFMAVHGDPYSSMVDEAESYVALGFRGIKMRCGVTPAADVELVARVRDRVGDAIALMIDLNTGYSRDRAAELVTLSRDSGLAWIEEPVASADADGFAELSALSSVPLAGGESLWRAEDFDALLSSGGLAVFQPDLYLCGGVTGMMRLAGLAAEHGIPLLPHVFGSSVNFAASLQVAAVIESRPSRSGASFPWFEFDQSDNPLRRIGHEFAIDGSGFIGIPSAPGLGVDFSREQFEPFASEIFVASHSSARAR